MNAWLDSLIQILERSYLEEFDEIYYLNSTKKIDKSVIEKAASEQNLKELLLRNESDSNEDLLDFFLLVNDQRQDLLVVFSPFELFENESIFHKVQNIEEDFSDLDTIELVK